MNQSVLDHDTALKLSILVNRARVAHENWYRATGELSRLKYQCGVEAKETEIERCKQDERIALREIARIAENLILDFDDEPAQDEPKPMTLKEVGDSVADCEKIYRIGGEQYDTRTAQAAVEQMQWQR